MDAAAQQAHIYRKATCPWGKKAVDLLKARRIGYVDHVFDDRRDEEQFKDDEGVKTTPQVYIQDRRVGGYDELANHLNVDRSESSDAESEGQSYQPVIVVFGTALLLALATRTGLMGFMGFSLCLLACLKLMDLRSFVEGFQQYDLLAARFAAYGWAYPVLELGVGLAFLAGAFMQPMAAIAVVIGVLGAVSITKAVYIDQLDLDCACVGGNYDVPLGFVSFTENAVMAGMGAAILLGLL